MNLRNKLSATAVAVAIVAFAANSAWSQDGNSADAQQDKIEQKTAELQEAIEAQVAAAQDAAEAVAEHASRQAEHAINQVEHAANMNFTFPVSFPFAARPNELAAIAEKVRDAKDEADKAAAKQQLTELVDKYFEDDMKRREQELAAITERVERLKTQLDRRRSKKQEIIDLQVKVAINDADGLGLVSQPGPPGGFVGSPPAWVGAPPVHVNVPVPMPAPNPTPMPDPKPVPSAEIPR